ncbi:MAG: tetratricopeptide repeat protein [Gammaproteobacteria bacterium]
MKITSRLVAATAATVFLIGAGLSSPAWSADAKADAAKANDRKVSKAAAKPLKAAKDAADAKKYPEALEKLKEVEALPDRTPWDTHVMNELYGYVYVRTQQYPEAAKALEAGLNDGLIDEADVQNRVKALAQVNYQIKDYPKAIEYGNRALKDGYADDDMYTLIGQAYYINKDYKGAIKFVDDYVTNDVKAGKTPKEQPLQLVLSSCINLEDNECTTKALERLVSYHPTPTYWQNLLYSLFQQEGQTDKSLLHVYRLASEVDVLKRPEDYTEYAQLAIEAGSPGEAQSILEKGMAKKVFTDAKLIDRNNRLLATAKTQAAADQAGLDKIAKDAAAGKTGDKDVSVGLAYISYKQYDKAVEAINRGLAKPGVQSDAEAHLLLGIAELGAGHKEEAQKAFGAVKGDPKLERIATLWGLHARQA